MELRFDIGKDMIRCVRSDGAVYSSPLELSDLATRQLAISQRQLAEGKLTSPDELQVLGEQLAQLLLTGEVAEGLQSALEESNAASEVLRVVLEIDATSDLASLPWEYLYLQEQGRGDFLAADPRLTLVRRVPHAGRSPVLPAPAPPLRLLVVTAEPEHTLYRAREALEPLLRYLQELSRVTFTLLERADLSKFKEAILRERPDIVHYAGFERARPDGGGLLLFHEDRGDSRWFDPRAIMVEGLSNIRLLVLQLRDMSLGEGSRDPTYPTSHVGLWRTPTEFASFVGSAVLGNQFAMPEDAAARFYRRFYEAALRGVRIDEALQKGRRRLWEEFGLPKGAPFGAPLLYLQQPQAGLLVAAEEPAIAPRLATIPTPPERPPQTREETEDSPVPKASTVPRAAPEPLPDRLPDDEPIFVGRQAEIGRLSSLLRRAGAARRKQPPIANVTGEAGIGKTALAVRSARQLRDHFPDGVLYLPFDDPASPAPAGAVELLRSALQALGPDQPPSTAQAEAVDRYREALAGRRVLVVLDGVRTRGDVDLFLPPTPSSAVLVTSRGRLTGQAVDLSPLSADEVGECLRRLLGSRPVEVSDELLSSVLAATGGNPRAVRLAADALLELPAARVVELVQAQRHLLDASVSLSSQELQNLLGRYRRLPPEGQRLFRLLGVAGDAEFRPDLADALVGTEGAAQLDQLVEAGLVERSRPDQYQVPDPTWLAALDRLRAQEQPAQQRIASVKALRWLVGLPAAQRAGHGHEAMRRAGYASDSVPDELQKDQHLEDHLGMKREVEALSWVVAARDVDPPLSVGLFGDWGSGKSYFMRLMVEQVKGIAKDAQAEEAAQAKDKTRPKFPAYPHIRQITFNAWHYVDANLWASLVTYIFEELARPGGRQPDQEVEHLLGQLQTTQLLTQEAEARKAQAQAERRQRTEELEKVKRQRMGRVKELEQGRVRHPAILTDEDVRGRATKLAEQSPRSDRPPLRPSEVVDLADGAAQVMKDPELLRRSMELVPDDDARRRLLDLADDPAVRDGLSDLAADRATVGQLAQLVGDPQFRQSAIDLIPDEERRQDVAELTTQLLQIYADVLSLGKAAADLRTTRGKLGYLWRSLRAAWSWKRLLASLMVLVAGVGLGIYLFRDRGLTLQGLVSVLVGTAAFLRLSVPVVQRSIGAVRSAADLAADAVDEPARRQIELLEAQETQLQREVEEARRQEYAAERELEEIRQGRRLYRYIEERASSSDYRQYLGVIALVRRDFERLAELMDQARTAQEDAAAAETASDAGDGPAQSLPRIDRVILYIDDLDRCPATRVVEVLEAVHLLLALKLFVVVVGVDSRWLVRSLQRHYRAQLSGEEPERPGVEDDRSEWQTTPQNYLEKIFQIAFSIRPMDRKGYEALLDALFRTTTAGDGQRAGNDGHPAGQDTAASPPPVAPASTPEVAGPPDQPGRRADGPAAAPAAPAASTEEAMPDPVDTDQDERLAKTDHPPRPSPTDDPEPAHGTTDPSGASAKASAKNAARAREALLITGEELRFMKRLAPFVPTPRSTKRLANTYRLLRVLVTGEEAAEFGPDKHESGHYRVALTLLAILIGFPRQATTLFGDLLSATDEDWPAFRRRLRGDRTPARADDLEATKGPAERDEGQSWERLLQCVDRLAADTDLPENLGPYKYWCQRVARYSFQTGRLAMLAGSDSDTAVVASGGPQLTTPSAPSANSSGRSRSGKLPPST